jgi:Domain of unknown function (DUF4395)
MNQPTHSHGPFALDCGVVLQRLRDRGFQLGSKEEACNVGPWLRFTPTLQALLFGVSTLTGSVEVLVVLAFVLAIAFAVGYHPFDLIYAGVIRPLEKSPALPRCPVRRRMVFLVGIWFCGATAWAFANDHMLAGSLIGGIMTASTTLLAATHICIPSMVMGWISRGMRRSS